MKKVLYAIVAVAVISTSFGACSNKNNQNQLEAAHVTTTKEAPVNASAEQAVAAVLKQVEEDQGSCGSVELSQLEFEEVTGITSEEYLDVVAFESEAKDGISNVFVVQPYPTLREDVRTKLLNYRESKIREYENFDILNSLSIAKDAVVYDQGDYLVMVMLEDNDTAQEQVDMYIPK